MIAIFEDVLSKNAIKDMKAKLSDGTFADGKLTAGYCAKRVKNNLQNYRCRGCKRADTR